MGGRAGAFGRVLIESFRARHMVGGAPGRRSRILHSCKSEDIEAESSWIAPMLLLNTSRHYSAEVHEGRGPMAVYQRHCKLGRLKPGDRTQEKVAAALDKLFQDLLMKRDSRGLQEWLLSFFWEPSMKGNFLQGIYIYGGVGRGKTMLMDVFYAEVNLIRKRRVHFHAFMLDVHSRLHKLLAQPNKAAGDSIKVVAEQLLKEAQVLCLDEVEVTDIADALILRRLFTVLWPLGMVVVATSNIGPDQLYRDGLNRHLFEPFIKQLKEHCHVYSLDEDQSPDYRRSLSTLDHLFLYPLGDCTDGLLDEDVLTLTGGVSCSITEVPVMMGRRLQILAAKGVARSSFLLLCGGPYGAADYLAIAQSFQALVLDRIPWLGDSVLENEARRFITLIDVLYEANIVFICSAAVSIDDLFKEKPDLDNNAIRELQQPTEKVGFHVVREGGSSGRSTLMIGEMEWSATGRMGASLANLQGSSSFTRAASARTVSRLVEMQSRGYLSRAGTFGAIILNSAVEAERNKTLK